MSDIADLLRVALQGRGLDRLERLTPARPADATQFMATGPSAKAVVTVVVARSATIEDLTHTEELSAERGAQGGLLIGLAGIDDPVRSAPKLTGFEVMDAPQFETLLGKAIVERSIARSADVLPDSHPPAPLPAAATFLKPRFSRLQAAETALGLLLRVDHIEAELVPFRSYSFYWDRLVEGSLKTERVSGTIHVNLSTGRLEELAEGAMEPSGPAEARTLDAKVTPQEAEAIARRHIIAVNSKDSRVRSQKGDVLMVEHRRVKPKEDEVKIDLKATFYVPVFLVKGDNGEVRINGVSGKVIDEQLKRPSHADIEMV
ncbi:MAG: hypothetical protein HY556_11290 [Euryarchaeota archaeon]|nr:hypothetical protein [Euryarchaeota archaeon]